MKYIVLLDRSDSTRDFEAIEQHRFIKSILEALEVPVKFNSEQALSIDETIRILRELNKFNITIVEDIAGGVKIYFEKEVIAEWFKPKYKLKQNYKEVNPKKKLYYEVVCEFFSAFEEGGKKS